MMKYLITSTIIIFSILVTSGVILAEQNDDDLSSAVTTVVWNNENKYSFSFSNIEYLNNYFWDGNITSHMNYKDAILTCRNKKYVHNGIVFDNFKLLPYSEIKTLTGRN